MSKILTQIKNTQTVRDIKAILQRGQKLSGNSSRRRILEIHWEVGQYLVKAYPSGVKAQLIRHLACTFSQPTVYFHTAIKFYQCYPSVDHIDDSLSWSEYKSVLSLT